MMSNSDAVRRQFGQVLAKYQPLLPSWPALMGNVQGVTHVPGRSGWVYVRVGSDEVPGMAFNNSFPVRANLLCMVGYDNLHPNLFQVLAMDAAYAAADSGDEMIPAVVAHSGTHALMGGDPVWIQKKQFVPLQATPTSPQSMKIWVQTDVYPWGSSWNWFTRTLSADLTARIATTLGKARYVLVSIDGATNLLQYTNGDEFTVLLPPPDIGDLIPAPPAGSVPIAAVYLPYGVTYLDWDSFFDVRMFNAPVGGSIAPPDHAHAGVAGDGGAILGFTNATNTSKWAAAKDVHPDNAGHGIFARMVNRIGIGTYDWHFRTGDPGPPTGYAWQAAPFVAPTLGGYNVGGDYMRGFATGVARSYMSIPVTNAAASWQNKFIYARVRTGLVTQIGVRFDDGTDNNYAEVRMNGRAGDGMQGMTFIYRAGGGAVSAVDSTLIIPCDTFIVLALACTYSAPNYVAYGYIVAEDGSTVDVTGVIYNFGAATFPAAGRCGIILENTMAGDYAYCDWLYKTFT